MLIAQISDSHIAPIGQKTCGVAQMDTNLRQCVQSINSLRPMPDLVLLSGDVTNAFSREEAEHAAEILSHLISPLFVVPGNHDDPVILSEVFGDTICPLNKEGFADYVIEGYPLRVIALDTLNAGKAGGKVSSSQLDWLHAKLGEAASQPTLIFAHHPPQKLGVPETDEDGFFAAEALGRLIARYPNVERFLCGHVHLHTNTRWCGTVVTTAPSIGMQLTLDLGDTKPSNFFLSDPAYLLHHWTLDQVLVTHHIQVSDLDGPFEFTQ